MLVGEPGLDSRIEYETTNEDADLGRNGLRGYIEKRREKRNGAGKAECITVRRRGSKRSRTCCRWKRTPKKMDGEKRECWSEDEEEEEEEE